MALSGSSGSIGLQPPRSAGAGREREAIAIIGKIYGHLIPVIDTFVCGGSEHPSHALSSLSRGGGEAEREDPEVRSVGTAALLTTFADNSGHYRAFEAVRASVTAFVHLT